jgi:Pyridoxamine 5'-phosphate oxidase
MSDQGPTETTNLDRYGDAELEWSRAHDALAGVPSPDITYFLGTCRPDGTPHAAGIGAQWLAGDLYFTSSPAARKARDLAVNPRCTISVRLAGIDLVLDGTAARVTDPEALEQVAAGYRAGGWPAQVDGDGFTAPFNAPSAGPPPWHVYRFTFRTVVGVATTKPYGATRWRFQRQRVWP